MLNTIIKFSINNKLIIGLFVLGLIIWGSWSLRQLPIDAVPDITNNQVQVITSSPSLAPQEVERLITFPVEQVMSTIPELEQVRSISRFGLSVVTIVFHDDVDIYWARQQVNEKLAEAKSNIPATLGNPEISPISTGLGEIYQYVISAQPGFEKKYGARELRTIQDWIVRRQLLGTPGVAEVNSFGGLLKQFEIGLDPEKLRSYNLSITDIFTALELNNRNAGGAYIDKKPTAYFIRTEGLVSSLNDINKIVVKNTASGLPVLIRDVATVQLGSSIRYGALTRTTDSSNGEAVGGIVMMLKGANANQVVKGVKSRIDRIAKTLPDGVIIEPFLDRSALVDRAMGTVAKNLVEGALIVIFVLVIFLGNLRAGLVVASVIPLAMLFAIAMMNLFGVSGNLMSLGAIDFGLIVDGAVIIVEATMHHLSNTRRLTQREMDEEVYDSAVKIRSAAAFGEIIILIVYLPILALVGIEGKMFRPMAQTVSFAILGAFILSLTYVPMVSALILSKNPVQKQTFSDRMMLRLHKWYDPLIKAAIGKKWWVVGTATGMLAISIFIFTRMGGEFIPNLEEGDLAVETRLLTGSSLSQTIDKVSQASAILIKQFPEVKEVVGKIGAAEIPTDPMPMESCDLTIVLKENYGDREELTERMSKALELVPGVTFGFSQPIQLRSNELISGVRQDVGIKIFGDDLDVLTTLSKKIGKIAAGVTGAKDLYLEQVEGLPQIIVRINRDRIAQYGLNVETVNQAVTAAFAGQSAGLVYEGEQRYDMVVRFSQQNRQSITDVKNIYVTAPSGIQLPLDQLADIAFEPGPNQIQREDTKRRIIVGLNVRGRDIQSVVNEIQGKIDQQIKLPTGYYITYGGQFENLQAASARLSVAVPVALALILLLLYFTFGSVKQSLLIFTAIPMAAIGGIFALLLRGMPFSISAGVGFIALFGVAVLNGIVLITEFNRLKKENKYSLPEIVLRGTEVRLRPVLMTATVASLGFLPMAISTAAGAEVQKPLATVVIGGLITSTILTLIVLPVLYIIFESWRPKPKVLLPLMLVCFALPASSQSITMDEAVAMALRNNQGVRSTTLEVSRQQALRGTAMEMGKTSVDVMYGQFNSIRRDNNITLSQGIPYPGVLRNRALLADAQIEGANKNVAVSKNDLTYQVRSAYTQLSFYYALATFLNQQDSIFGNFRKASALRYETGETTLLESTTAATQYNEVRNQLEKNQADIRAYKAALQRLLNTTDSITPAADAFKPDRQVLPQLVDTNPIIAQQQQQIVIADKTIRLERSLSAPDFTIGYFNQSILGPEYGDKRFQGVQAGIAIPLFYKPYASRIKAARIDKQIAESQLDFFKTNLTGEYSQATQELLKNARSIDYYEQSALPNADLIRHQAQLAFQNGEIGYVELLQSLKTSSDIRLGYLQAINLYNQSVYRIKYLAGI